jgi:hypothetical protein
MQGEILGQLYRGELRVRKHANGYIIDRRLRRFVDGGAGKEPSAWTSETCDAQTPRWGGAAAIRRS